MAKLIKCKAEYWLRMALNEERFIRDNDVKTIIETVKENGTLESDDPADASFWSNDYHKVIYGLAYQLRGNEYIITEDGKIFYWYTLMEIVEILDEDEAEKREFAKINDEIDKGNVMRIVAVDKDKIWVQTKPYCRWNQYVVKSEKFAKIANRFFPSFVNEFEQSGCKDMLDWFYEYGKDCQDTYIFIKA